MVYYATVNRPRVRLVIPRDQGVIQEAFLARLV
jgi:hypothetical protein